MPYSSGRQVAVCRLVEFTLWGLVPTLLALGAAVGFAVRTAWFPAVVILTASGLALSAAAATVSIRNRISRQEAHMRDVFLMGQEAATIRPLERTRPSR